VAPPPQAPPPPPPRPPSSKGRKLAEGALAPDTARVPFPSSKRPRRRCVLCGLPELMDVSGHGRFLFVPDPQGRGPVCPSGRGCSDRQRQLSLLTVQDHA
jgi:hypothetical protein